MRRHLPSRVSRALLGIAMTAGFLLGLAPAAPVRAAGALTIEADAMLQGHVRAGSWFAIAVDVANTGPTVTGELRIAGGIDSRTRFGTAVELATGSRKEYLLYD